MPSETENWSHLEPKVKGLWVVQGLISGGVMGGLGLVMDLTVIPRVDAWPLPQGALALVAFVLFAGSAVAFAGAKYHSSRYLLGTEDLAYASGIFWKSCRYIARARIQHVDVTSGPIARALGLVHLSVYVGGQVGAAINIPGLSPHEAERLRHTLMASRQAPAPEPPPIAPAAPIEP